MNLLYSQDNHVLVYIDSPEFETGLSKVETEVLSGYNDQENIIVYCSNDEQPLISRSRSESIENIQKLRGLNPGSKRIRFDLNNLNRIILDEGIVSGLNGNPNVEKLKMIFFTTQEEYLYNSFEDKIIAPILLANRFLSPNGIHHSVSIEVVLFTKNPTEAKSKQINNHYIFIKQIGL